MQTDVLLHLIKMKKNKPKVGLESEELTAAVHFTPTVNGTLKQHVEFHPQPCLTCVSCQLSHQTSKHSQ